MFHFLNVLGNLCPNLICQPRGAPLKGLYVIWSYHAPNRGEILYNPLEKLLVVPAFNEFLICFQPNLKTIYPTPTPNIPPIISLIVVFELSIFGFKAFKWVLSYVPFIGGR